MGRLRGARGPPPPGGLRAPWPRRAEAHSPARGAGDSARSASGALRSVWPHRHCARLVSGVGLGGRAGLRPGLTGPRPFARWLARSGLAAAGGTGRSRPRGERRQLAARGRHLHSAAPPRPPRPAPPPGRDPPGRRPAPAPPVRGVGSRAPRRWGSPRPVGLTCTALPPWLRGRRPRPPRLCLSVDTPHTAPGVYPGTQLPGGKGRRAREQEAALTCAPPAVSVLPRCPPRLASREPRSSGPRTARAAQQVAVQPLGRLTLLDLSSTSTPGQVSCLQLHPTALGLPVISQQPALFQASSSTDPSVIFPHPRS